MPYQVYRNKKEFDGTGFIEIGPGKYSGKHWQEGFLFLWERTFWVAEGIIDKHFPEYESYDMNDLPADVARNIAADWRAAAECLPSCSNAEEVLEALCLKKEYSPEYEIWAHRNEVAEMLLELSAGCAAFAAEDDWICILGI